MIFDPQLNACQLDIAAAVCWYLNCGSRIILNQELAVWNSVEQIRVHGDIGNDKCIISTKQCGQKTLNPVYFFGI
jgi:hypothetical protein